MVTPERNHTLNPKTDRLFHRRAAAMVRRAVSTCALLCIAPLAAGDAVHMRADLTIEEVQVAPANPSRLRVRVANLGLSPAVETELKLFYQRGGEVEIRSAAVPMLETGERQWLVVEGGALMRDAEIVTIRIDDPDRVLESDENNNVAEYPELPPGR